MTPRPTHLVARLHGLAARLTGLAVLVMVLLLGPSSADAGTDAISYKVRAGDTLDLIAAEYYGDRNHSIFIMAANRLVHPRPLRPGERLQIPISREVTTAPGDSFATLASAYLGDPRRARFLAEFNDASAEATLAAGTVVTIPFHVVHTASGEETLASVSLAKFGDNKQARLLREYNFLDGDKLSPGQAIVVPIFHVRVRAAKLPPVDAEARARTSKRQQTREAAIGALPGARAAWRRGDYGEVKRVLAGIDLDYLDANAAVDLGLLLAGAYVAFADDDSALAVFRRLVERRAGLQLDPYRYSPKIRALWARASTP
ncbi:MAG: LysM peptidoglycan-binding domain-containing protein [Kofleriaceae bacterium]|jgi:LysM repeat protein|nr:LysM peptidoglycan-binding domain-containing protein [Kofleriaceae bacterium]